MDCPKCKSVQVRTIDSRCFPSTVKRRRECQECGHRFTTLEVELGVLRTAHDALRVILDATSILSEK